MTRSYLASGAALAALLLIGGCGSASRYAMATAAQANGTMLAGADIPRPPAIPDEATDAQAAPLNDAGEIASEISANTMIEEVPVNGGLAWREDGQVVRTASNDGQRVAYFRAGQSRPFFVQRGGLAYAYQDGRAALAYDSQGRPAPVPTAAQMEAQRLADQAQRERDAAARAPAEAAGR
ncbi:hypothetical protein [Allosphingosinicella sp.]|uniref:hypothetical protein n=1 Tax=Allosphingosinicella sp. TaxID=2823234 RepID=UPI003784DACD